VTDLPQHFSRSSEQGTTRKALKIFDIKVEATFWPRLSFIDHVRSTLDNPKMLQRRIREETKRLSSNPVL